MDTFKKFAKKTSHLIGPIIATVAAIILTLWGLVWGFFYLQKVSLYGVNFDSIKIKSSSNDWGPSLSISEVSSEDMEAIIKSVEENKKLGQRCKSRIICSGWKNEPMTEEEESALVFAAPHQENQEEFEYLLPLLNDGGLLWYRYEYTYDLEGGLYWSDFNIIDPEMNYLYYFHRDYN